MTVSILLNFSQNIEFAKTDPLMGIVTAREKLLFYNSLSVGSFQYDKKDQFIKKKIANLRNMLENRSLSSDDRDEHIRLIVVLDFNYWEILAPSGGDSDETTQLLLGLPALKVNYLKSRINEIFGEKNPLLRRLEFDFIFVDNDNEHSRFYRDVMFRGYGGERIGHGWIPKDALELNSHKVNSNGQDRGLGLDDVAVRNDFRKFETKCNDILDGIRSKLDPINLGDVFWENAKSVFDDIKTLGQHWDFDYDATLQSIVGELVGLNATKFRDCVFFLLKVKRTPSALKCEGETVLKSLLQLLCTIDDRNHTELFCPIASSSTPKLFILCETNVNKEAFPRLCNNVAEFRLALEDFVWKDSMVVEYNEYGLLEADEKDSHDEHNKQLSDKREEKRNAFWKKSRIPFFFGKKVGDWSWYLGVIEDLNKAYRFEAENNGPLHDNLSRVSDEKLKVETKKCTYGLLKERHEELLKENVNVESNVDFEKYLTDRKEKIKDLGEAILKLKKEMVKLGFRSCLLWVAIVSCLVFTLCYAYHFFYVQFDDKPVWIGAAFLAIALIFLMASVWAQNRVKSRIKRVYIEIQAIFSDIDKLQDDYLKTVRELDMQMKKADAHRKTVAEVQERVSEFDGHNKKIELWETHFDGMIRLLDDSIDKLQITQKSTSESLSFDDEILGKFPVIPMSIWQQDVFLKMQPLLRITTNNLERHLDEVTSFVKKYEFACEQK